MAIALGCQGSCRHRTLPFTSCDSKQTVLTDGILVKTTRTLKVSKMTSSSSSSGRVAARLMRATAPSRLSGGAIIALTSASVRRWTKRRRMVNCPGSECEAMAIVLAWRGMTRREMSMGSSRAFAPSFRPALRRRHGCDVWFTWKLSDFQHHLIFTNTTQAARHGGGGNQGIFSIIIIKI